MKKLDELLLGLSYKSKSFKNELFKNNKNLKIILITYLLLLIFVGYQLFSRRSNINFFGYTLSIIFFALYLLAIYALTKMILVEFGIIKKNKLGSKFLNSSKQQFRLSEKKYFKPNETTMLQDEVVILNKKTSNNSQTIKSVKDDLIKGNKNHTDFIKNEFEPTKNLVNKNTNEIVISSNKISNNKLSINSLGNNIINVKKDLKTSNNKIEINKLKIEDHLLKKEKLTPINGFSMSKFEIILNTYQKNLFPNIKTNHFSDFAFTEKTETFKGKIKKPELRKFIEFLKILQLNHLIGKNKTLLSKVIKHYFQLTEGHDTINRWINLKEYSFINEKTVKQIESYIQEIK
jgi:hypothetical protein